MSAAASHRDKPIGAGGGSSSRFVTETVNGSHQFLIKGYSLAKGIGVGKHIASENFSIGGYDWAIYFYPDGKNPEDNSTYVSVFIALASDGTDVRALFELTLLDQGPDAKHKVHSHFDRSLESGPYTLKYRGSMWGYKRFYRRTMLESSTFLKDDCLKINCTVGVVVSAIDSARLHSIQVPESDIGAHFAAFLENGEGSDVTFVVAGVRFNAHKLLLTARSPEFGNEFFGGMEDENNEIVVDDMEPKVFKALLHFFYTDTLIEDEELSESSSSSSVPSLSDVLAAKLLAAADKYGLTRLRLICESVLCKEISVTSVANILTLADRYSAIELKSVCLKFAAENLVAVMETEGFELLKENCPLLQSELLKTVAGSEEELSAGGKSQSVWAQFSDGGNSNGRRPRQQTENGEHGQRIWVRSLDGNDARDPSPMQEGMQEEDSLEILRSRLECLMNNTSRPFTRAQREVARRLQLSESEEVVDEEISVNNSEPEVESTPRMASIRSLSNAIEANGTNTLPSCIAYPQPATGNEGEFELKGSLLHHLPKFHGLSNEDPHKHIKEFQFICVSLGPKSVDLVILRLKAFPFTLEDRAKTWLLNMPPGCVTSWETMTREFLSKFFPASRTTVLMKQITGIQQGHDESFGAYYESFKGLVASCPSHGIQEGNLLQYFYEGLNSMDRKMLDAAAGGSFVDKTPAQAKDLLDNRAMNDYQFCGISRETRQVKEAYVMPSLEAKIDTLIKNLAAKKEVKLCGLCQDPENPNDHCSTLYNELTTMIM